MIEIEIELISSKPRIWRRLMVPGSLRLCDMHQVIQIAMGWSNYHWYSFRVENKEYSKAAFKLEKTLSDKKLTIAGALKRNLTLGYTYDFGDSWDHTITCLGSKFLEEEIPPFIINGERGCPLEDSGRISWYQEVLADCAKPEENRNPDIPEAQGGFDPELFDPRHASAALATWWLLLRSSK